MEWLIYIILGFIYWKMFPWFALTYLLVLSTAICWYISDELIRARCHNRKRGT